jgi:hypothetical protein
MGLDITSAFSRSELRRQRDRLMNTHHPDRGGAENMAVRVNETYARMAAWLDRRRFRREKYQPKEAIFPVAEPADDRPKRRGAAIRIRAAQLYAAAMMAAVGYTMFRRRR